MAKDRCRLAVFDAGNFLSEGIALIRRHDNA